MTTYKGNKGNLLQHWTLCQLLIALQKNFESSFLHYIDAYAMAPNSRLGRTPADKYFRACQYCLPGRLSKYEKTWAKLVFGDCENRYPSSAQFVEEIWYGKLQMTLFERDKNTASAIQNRIDKLGLSSSDRSCKLHFCDWRCFPYIIETDETIRYVQFDPYSIWPTDNNKKQDHGSLYPRDFKDVIKLCGTGSAPAIVQLSSYSVNNGRKTQQIEGAITNEFSNTRFNHLVTIKADDATATFIFGKNITNLDLKELATNFEKWLSFFKKSNVSKEC